LDTYAEWITAIASAAIVYYAYVTIKEGKKNRRKDTIEKMLENLYSPLYEILRRAKFENDERSQARSKIAGFDWVVYRSELDQMQGIIERFGHYFDNQAEAEELSMLIMRPKYTRVGVSGIFGFDEQMASHFDYIKNSRDKLRKELLELTKT